MLSPEAQQKLARLKELQAQREKINRELESLLSSTLSIHAA
jgi:hypothetical protein